MTDNKFRTLQNSVGFICVALEEFDNDSGNVNLTDCPFPNCEIMWVGHTSFFAPNPSMPRDFKVIGDESLHEADEDWRTFWVPLEPTDNWLTIVQKADRLAELSGDRHHRMLEGFDVVGNILVPYFGS